MFADLSAEMKIKEYTEVFESKIFVGSVNLDWGILMGLG